MTKSVCAQAVFLLASLLDAACALELPAQCVQKRGAAPPFDTPPRSKASSGLSSRGRTKAVFSYRKAQPKRVPPPPQSFAFRVLELKPPIVSFSRPLIEPLLSKIKTSSVRSSFMCVPLLADGMWVCPPAHRRYTTSRTRWSLARRQIDHAPKIGWS